MADVGTGATLTFGTSNFQCDILTITPPPITRPSVDITHLGTTGGRTKMAGDLYDIGEMSVSFLYDPDEQPPYSGAKETITLSFPVPSGSTNAATFAASGFVTSFTQGSIAIDEAMVAEMTIQFSDDATFADAS